MLVQDPGTGAQPSASQSSSFAFSRAGLTPGVHNCPEEPEAGRNARVHPLGFFAAEGARQLCHVEGKGPTLEAGLGAYSTKQHWSTLFCNNNQPYGFT